MYKTNPNRYHDQINQTMNDIVAKKNELKIREKVENWLDKQDKTENIQIATHFMEV